MLALEMTANIASSSAVGTPSTVSPRSALRSIAPCLHGSGARRARGAGRPATTVWGMAQSAIRAGRAPAGAPVRRHPRAASSPRAFTGGWELDVDGTPQSHVDLDDPTHLHFEYVARMGAVIDQLRMPGQPLTAVHLGAGALTIPRYVEATRPGSRQQVIELEPALVDLVREQLPLPRGASIRVRIGDAREGLGRLPAGLVGNVDLLVSDVYSGAQTPAHLTTVEFYREAAARCSRPTACCSSTSPTARGSPSPAARSRPCGRCSSTSSCSPRCRRSRAAGSATS